jgi:hypothetical protein
VETDGQCHILSHQQVGKLEYLWHRCPLRRGNSASLEGCFQQKDSGACPPSGTHPWVECLLQERPKGCLEALCMGVCRLTMSDKKKELMMEAPFGSEDQDPFPSSRWRS